MVRVLLEVPCCLGFRVLGSKILTLELTTSTRVPGSSQGSAIGIKFLPLRSYTNFTGAFYVVFLLRTAGFLGYVKGLFFFFEIPYLQDLWGAGLGSGSRVRDLQSRVAETGFGIRIP